LTLSNRIQINIKTQPNINWNKLIVSSEFGTYFQSVEYAKSRSKILGHIPLFFQFFNEKNDVVGQLLCFKNRYGLGRFKKKFGEGKLYSVFKKMSFPIKHLSWTYGPIVTNPNYKNDLMISLANYIQANNYHINGSLHPLDSQTFPSSFNFIRSKKATFIIDLKEEIETIFKNTDKHSVQKNIKRSEERGVKVREIITEEDVRVNHKLLKEHRKRNKLSYTSKDNTLLHFKIGKNKGVTGFLAEYNGKAIASITLIYLNGYLVEQGIARSSVDLEKKLYGQELLRWNIIKWGKKKKCRFYDLAGVKAENMTTKENGIFKNKEKWGGKLISYSIYSKK